MALLQYVLSLALFMHSVNCGGIEVSQKLARVKDLFETLCEQSDKLDAKVNGLTEDVEDFKCAFSALKEDVEALESANVVFTSEEEARRAENEDSTRRIQPLFDDIPSALEEKKETAEIILDFSHPCGGSGWTRIALLDTRDPEAVCPGDTQLMNTTVNSPVCAASFDEFPSCTENIQFSSPMNYSSVCGRIFAFHVGDTKAFVNGSGSVNLPYLDGISLTRGGTLDGTSNDEATHIWSFASGLSTDNSTVDEDTRCPCDGGLDPPAFVGEDYFCETSSFSNDTAEMIANMTFPGNLLWDGLGCPTTSECCSNPYLPYFVKHLGENSNEEIDLRICVGTDSQNILVQLIELFVK